MAFFGRVGIMLRNATNRKITSEFRSFPSVFQAIRCFSNSPSSKLFVGGVSYSTDEQSLREVFSKYGEVVDVRIIMDRETGRSKGFGFITYSTVEEASSAIQALDGQDLHGRRVGVNFANERPRGFGGGGFDGSYGNTSYGGGGGGGYQGGYGNSSYSAPSSGGGYGDADGYGGNAAGGYGGGGYGSARNFEGSSASNDYNAYSNNANYGASVGGDEINTVNYGSTPAAGGYGGNNVNHGATDAVNYGSAPGVGGCGGGNNVNYGAPVSVGESNSVNYGSAPGVGGYGSDNNANYGAPVVGGESNSVNYDTAPVDGGYGAAAGFSKSDNYYSTAGGGPINGFASSQYPGNASAYGSGGSGTGRSFAGGYDRSGGPGYSENGQVDSRNVGGDFGGSVDENFRNDDHEVGAFAKRA